MFPNYTEVLFLDYRSTVSGLPEIYFRITGESFSDYQNSQFMISGLYQRIDSDLWNQDVPALLSRQAQDIWYPSIFRIQPSLSKAVAALYKIAGECAKVYELHKMCSSMCIQKCLRKMGVAFEVFVVCAFEEQVRSTCGQGASRMYRLWFALLNVIGSEEQK